MIEDFMIVANETVAEYITNFGYPMMYRIHEAPREKKLKEFLDLLKALGHKVKFKGKLKDIKPKQVQEILDGLKDSPDYEMLSELGLRAMQKQYIVQKMLVTLHLLLNYIVTLQVL